MRKRSGSCGTWVHNSKCWSWSIAPGLVLLGLRPWMTTHNLRPAISIAIADVFAKPTIVSPAHGMCTGVANETSVVNDREHLHAKSALRLRLLARPRRYKACLARLPLQLKLCGLSKRRSPESRMHINHRHWSGGPVCQATAEPSEPRVSTKMPTSSVKCQARQERKVGHARADWHGRRWGLRGQGRLNLH